MLSFHLEYIRSPTDVMFRQFVTCLLTVYNLNAVQDACQAYVYDMIGLLSGTSCAALARTVPRGEGRMPL